MVDVMLRITVGKSTISARLFFLQNQTRVFFLHPSFNLVLSRIFFFYTVNSVRHYRMLNWPMSEKFCRRLVGEAVKIYDLWLPARNSKMHKSQNKLLTPLELRWTEKLSVPYIRWFNFTGQKFSSELCSTTENFNIKKLI